MRRIDSATNLGASEHHPTTFRLLSDVAAGPSVGQIHRTFNDSVRCLKIGKCAPSNGQASNPSAFHSDFWLCKPAPDEFQSWEKGATFTAGVIEVKYSGDRHTEKPNSSADLLRRQIVSMIAGAPRHSGQHFPYALRID
jgi:hypothetical protein